MSCDIWKIADFPRLNLIFVNVRFATHSLWTIENNCSLCRPNTSEIPWTATITDRAAEHFKDLDTDRAITVLTAIYAHLLTQICKTMLIIWCFSSWVRGRSSRAPPSHCHANRIGWSLPLLSLVVITTPRSWCWRRQSVYSWCMPLLFNITALLEVIINIQKG